MARNYQREGWQSESISKSFYINNGPFDVINFPKDFPPVNDYDDKEYNEAVMKRMNDLQPSPADITSLSNHVLRVTNILDSIMISPDIFEPAILEEVRHVGSSKLETTMANGNLAQVVVIFRTLPTLQSIRLLSVKVIKDLKHESHEDISVEVTDRGFDVHFVTATVCILISTIAQNMRCLDQSLHLKCEYMQEHIMTLRYTKWFNDNSQNQPGIKAVVRLLEDLKSRFAGLQGLTEWMILLLSHFSMSRSSEGLPLSVPCAYRRSLQLLSSGFYLQSSNAVIDPCGHSPMFAHINLTEQDTVTMTAQTLLRVLGNGGFREILGLTSGYQKVGQLTVVQGIVVTSSEPALQRNPMDLPLN